MPLRTPEIEKQADAADLAIFRAAEAIATLEELLLAARFPYEDRDGVFNAKHDVRRARAAVRAWMNAKRKQETPN